MKADIANLVPSSAAISARNHAEARWSKRLQIALFALLLLVFIGKTIIPAWRHYGTDIPNYYMVARVYREHLPIERVYEWTWLQRQEDHSDIGQHLVGFIPSTPLSALLIAPLANLPILQAHRYWILVNLALLIAIGLLLKRISHLKWIHIGVLVLLATGPLHVHFMVGQVHLVVLLLLTVAACLYFEDWPFSCGVVLAAAAALKIYPALFLFYFVIKKNWRAVSGLAAGGFAAGTLWISLFGLDSFRTYIREILPWGLRGENIDPYNIGWNSIDALLHRVFIAEPELNPAPIRHWPILYAFLQPMIAAILVVAFVWAIGPRADEPERKKLEWAGYLFLLLLLSSEPLTYHFVALILTTVLLVNHLLLRHEIHKAGAITVVYALICLPYNRLFQQNPAGWKTLLYFPRLFFMLLFASVMVWIFFRSSRVPPETRLNSRTALSAALAVVVLAAVGLGENVRHLRGHFQNYQSRVLTVPGSIMAADPLVTTHGVLSTTLVARLHTSILDGYAAQLSRDGSVTSFALGHDSYHPAATPAGDLVWVEEATNTGSRIVAFPLSGDPNANNTVEVEDAEQPVVSSDGEWLAYLREARGRSSLWIHNLRMPENADRQIAGSDYDVREAAFFPDHRLIFSSRRDGQFRLYIAAPSWGSPRPTDYPGCPARYPAISPDGLWIAFACEHGGYWQLHSMNLNNGRQFQLTDGDCNSVSPAWTLDFRSLVYATDCGRGLGMTALAKTNAFR